MRKLICIAVIFTMSGWAAADIYVDWDNDEPLSSVWVFQNSFAGNNVESGSLVQLIWSASAPTADFSHYSYLGGVQSGQYILANDVTESLGNWSGNGVLSFDNNDVGGHDIHSGYVFTRVFDSAVITTNSVYAEFSVFDESTPGVLDSNTTYMVQTSALDLSAIGFAGRGVLMDQQVIPEPASLSLMMVLGAVLVYYRRLADRAGVFR